MIFNNYIYLFISTKFPKKMKISNKTDSLVARLSEYSTTVYCLNARLKQVKRSPAHSAISLLADLLLGWLVFS